MVREHRGDGTDDGVRDGIGHRRMVNAVALAWADSLLRLPRTAKRMGGRRRLIPPASRRAGSALSVSSTECGKACQARAGRHA